MSVDPDNAIALAALDELAKTRAALVAALGGEDGIPDSSTLPQMVDALVQFNRFYYTGWVESHIRHQQAKRLLRENGIEAHTTAMGKTVRRPLSRHSGTTNIDPPAVRWLPAGSDQGIYLYAPNLGGKWRRTAITQHGVRDETVDALPLGTEQLFCWADVCSVLHEYRDIRRDEGLADISGQRHAEILDEIWCLLLDAGDWPQICADTRWEREREQANAQRCHRVSVAGRCSEAGTVEIRGSLFCDRCAKLVRGNTS